MNEKLIGLEDLPDNFGVKLEDGFREKFLDRAIFIAKGVKKLSELLNCDRTAIWQWKTGKILTKVSLLKKLSGITRYPLEEIESKIEYIRRKRTGDKDFIKIKFPILASPELASVIGHSIGDGNVSERQFSFFNQSIELVDEVIKNTNIAFDTDVVPEIFEKSGGQEIEFPTNIALLVNLAGSPIGEKVKRDFRIPNWIKCGNKEIKSAFIRALIDDEGSINKSNIVFGMAKKEELLESHRIFIEELKEILLNLGVESNPIQKPLRINSGSVQLFFSIGKKELPKFIKNVGFTNSEKNYKVSQVLKKNINSDIKK
jgi:intein/homing endonuclease